MMPAPHTPSSPPHKPFRVTDVISEVSLEVWERPTFWQRLTWRLHKMEQKIDRLIASRLKGK
jgi:hypothetical protein